MFNLKHENGHTDMMTVRWERHQEPQNMPLALERSVRVPARMKEPSVSHTFPTSSELTRQYDILVLKT